MVDHDEIHKAFFHCLIREFLVAFLPKVARGLDLNEVEFLEQSFGALEEGGKRVVDVLAQFRLLDGAGGEPQFVLFHIENQASRDPLFAFRMLAYFMKIKLRYPNAIVYPIALFTHDCAVPEADMYEIKAFGMDCLTFQFHVIQLRLEDWREWAERDEPNLAVAALLAKMGKDSDDRVQRRLAALKQLDQLAAQGVEPTKLHLVVSYLDTYLDLDESEALQLREGMDKIGLSKENRIMEFLTKVEKEALVRGREEGLEKGREEGREKGREEKGEEMRAKFITRIRDGLGEHELELTSSQAERLVNLSEPDLWEAFALLHKDASALPGWLDNR